jgi:hypothetical protein
MGINILFCGIKMIDSEVSKWILDLLRVLLDSSSFTFNLCE